MNQKNTIVVGLSGGVDSSVAAYRCLQAGHRVIGMHMQNWDENDSHCPQTQDWKDVQHVAEQLNIEVHRVNLANEYWSEVFENFLEELAKGRTPNPDILCNQWIKFHHGLQTALNLGADLFATGHYAKIVSYDGSKHLLKCADDNKDQTYFLSRLDQNQLEKVVFPLANLTKQETRRIAQEANLITAKKPDSSGICFIGERKFNSFISEYLLDKPGKIRDENGAIIGEHRGLMYHTIGQRKGLKIGGKRNRSGEAWYVLEKCIKNNELIVVQGGNHPKLFSKALRCSGLHWINPPSLNTSITAKIRHQQPEQSCTLHTTINQTLVRFEQPQRAIAPGQYIAFYQNEECLGSAVIEETVNE